MGGGGDCRSTVLKVVNPIPQAGGIGVEERKCIRLTKDEFGRLLSDIDTFLLL